MTAAKIASQREARRLRSKGMSLRSIARDLGVSLSSVSVWTRGVVMSPSAPTTETPAADSVESRRCGACKSYMPVTEFHKGQNWCKPCRAEYIRERGELHLQQMRAARERRRAAARRHVLGLLATANCADCGLADPVVLEFDHVEDKTADISLLVHEGYALARIEAEVACCEIVCASCHRRRTNRRAGGSWRLNLETRIPVHRPLQRRNLRFLLDHLCNAACVGCGESDLEVLEFDHVGLKRKGVVSLAFGEYSIEYLRTEIEQCEIRCTNCHRRQTIRRQPSHLRHHLLQPP